MKGERSIRHGLNGVVDNNKVMTEEDRIAVHDKVVIPTLSYH